MVKKNKFKWLQLFFILSVSLWIFLSTASYGQAKPFPEDQVNLTIPSSISIQQINNGELVISDLIIENKTPVGFNVENVQVQSFNGWDLVNSKENLNFNSKRLVMALENHQLGIGENMVNIPINRNSSKKINIDIDIHCFDKPINEKAFELVVDYTLVPRKFVVSFYNPKGDSIRPISGLSGETIQLPCLDIYNFMGWKDSYTDEFYGTSMIMPIGGTRVVAQYKENTLDIEKFNRLPFMGNGGTSSKDITGLTFKHGKPSNLNFEYWDVSKLGNNSIICYRESQDSSNSQYNNVVVATDEIYMDIEGSVEKMFVSTSGKKTPIRFFRAEDMSFRMNFANINYWFEGCEELTDITGLEYLITDNLTSIEGTFKGCKNLRNLEPLRNISAANIQNYKDAFSGCAMDDISPLANWNVSKGNDFSGIFANCPNLTSTDLSNWDIGISSNVEGMFFNSPLKTGYAKTQAIADLLNNNGGVTGNCFQIKP